MKNNHYIALIGLSLLAASCSKESYKQVSSSTSKVAVTVRDTVTSADTSILRLQDSSYTIVTVRDTAVGVPGATVTIVLADSNRDDEVNEKKGNVTLHAWTDKKGNRHEECKADSLTIVINNRVQENSYMRKSIEDYVSQNAITDHSEIKDSVASSATLTEVVKKENSGFFARVGVFLKFLGLFLLGCLTGYFIIPKIIKVFV